METDLSLNQMILPALFVIAVGLYLSYKITGSIGWSIFIVSIKTTIFLGYWLSAPYIYPGDGLGYFQESDRFDDISFWTFVSNPDAVWGGGHWGYYLLNWGAKGFFGDFIAAPIAINVALTYLSGLLLLHTLQLLGLSRRLAIFATVFYLISPEVITWSTLFNLKDTLVQFLSILYIYLVARRLNGRTTIFSIAMIGIPVIAVTTVRVYLPLIMAVHFIMVELWIQRRRLRPTHLVLGSLFALGFGFLITRALGVDYQSSAAPLVSLGDGLFGFAKILTTPVPWSISEPYTNTLLLASWFHWLLMPFAGLGLFLAVMRYPNTLMLLVFALGVMLFLALFTNLLGPRHRFQVSFVFAVFQAIGLYPILMAPFWRRAAPEEESGEAFPGQASPSRISLSQQPE